MGALVRRASRRLPDRRPRNAIRAPRAPWQPDLSRLRGSCPRCFYPGWGARASLYRDALFRPAGRCSNHPRFRDTAARSAPTPPGCGDELDRRTGPFVLGGHSFGAALTVLAAARGEANIERLVLVEPGRPAALQADAPVPGALQRGSSPTGVYPVRPAVQSVGSAHRRPAGRAPARPRRLRPRPPPASSPSSEAAGCPCTVLAAGTRHAHTACTLPCGRPPRRRRLPGARRGRRARVVPRGRAAAAQPARSVGTCRALSR